MIRESLPEDSASSDEYHRILEVYRTSVARYVAYVNRGKLTAGYVRQHASVNVVPHIERTS
jgi:hypothetical protein